MSLHRSALPLRGRGQRRFSTASARPPAAMAPTVGRNNWAAREPPSHGGHWPTIGVGAGWNGSEEVSRAHLAAPEHTSRASPPVYGWPARPRHRAHKVDSRKHDAPDHRGGGAARRSVAGRHRAASDPVPSRPAGPQTDAPPCRESQLAHQKGRSPVTTGRAAIIMLALLLSQPVLRASRLPPPDVPSLMSIRLSIGPDEQKYLGCLADQDLRYRRGNAREKAAAKAYARLGRRA
jgi:hypothetical protein